MSDPELEDFYDVLAGGLEQHRIRGVEAEGYSVAEVLPGVFELVAEADTDRLEGLSDVLDKFDQVELWDPGKFIQTDWEQLEDGRWTVTFMYMKEKDCSSGT